MARKPKTHITDTSGYALCGQNPDAKYLVSKRAASGRAKKGKDLSDLCANCKRSAKI